MSADDEASVTIEAANTALVRQFFELWTDRDLDGLGELVQPDAPWWSLFNRRSKPARLQLEQIRGVDRETVNGFRFRLGPTVAEDDRVSAIVEGDAQFPGREPYTQMYHFFFRVRDGQFSEIRMYYDTALSDRVMRGEGAGLAPLASHAPASSRQPTQMGTGRA